MNQALTITVKEDVSEEFAIVGKVSYTRNGVLYHERDDAQSLAAYLNKTDDDGWTYEVDVVKPAGTVDLLYRIKIFDEDEIFVAYLGS